MEKQPHTVAIFSEVAPKYEFLNSLMTAGLDRRWRKTMLGICESALGSKPSAALDLATGTGDVARMMAERWTGCRVAGSDPTPAMLAIAQAKAASQQRPLTHKQINWMQGVAEEIAFADASLDIVTIAFGFRNVAAEDRHKAVEEALRVLRPGGVFGILELGLPSAKIWRAIYTFLLKNGMPRFAGLFAPRDPYDYLAQSVIDFPPPEQVKKLLAKAGFLPFAPRPLSAGMAWLYVGKRPLTES